MKTDKSNTHAGIGIAGARPAGGTENATPPQKNGRARCSLGGRVLCYKPSGLSGAGVLVLTAVGIALAGGCASATGDEVGFGDEDLGQVSLAAVSEGKRKDIILVSQFTKYGQGEVQCPSDTFAIGGGSKCTNGELDNSFPLTANVDDYLHPVPTGWGEWHRGASSNDCKVYAICAPRVWFDKDDIKAVAKDTGYGTGSVSCGAGFKAVGGGSRCTNGDFDMAYPNATLSGWEEWHRGASSNDCKAHAVCVRDTHWMAKGAFRTETNTGYGRGSTTCGNAATVLGGGSYCTGGDDGDFNRPATDLTGWEQWHRGASTNDCRVSAVCLKDSVYNLVEVGAPCSGGQVRDCNKQCVSLTSALTWKNNTTCEQRLNCQHFDFDGGHCF